MKSQHTFALSFYLKRENELNGKAPIYAKITVDGKYLRLAVKRSVEPKFWNQRTQRLLGNTPEIISLREKLRQVTNEINGAYDELRYQKKAITAQAIKSKVEGDEEGKTLMYLIKYHYEHQGALLAKGTIKNYYSTERFLKEFLQKKKLKDIQLMALDFRFITEFAVYLRKKEPDRFQRPCTNNTVMKHLERLQKLTGIALKFGWIITDPFLNHKRLMVRKDRECLDMDEISELWSLEIENEQVMLVKEMFLFSCYTGLSYNEISRLTNDYIRREADGSLWIEMIRQKTLNTSELKFHVPLLPESLGFIEKYEHSTASLAQGTIFATPSNQYMNRCLKIIARLAGINKRLTFHIARHTFATTITLENGVSLESVAHMLGHSSTRTTQIYSKVKKKKVASEMNLVKQKLHPVILKIV
ncbi:integrase [Pedobacter kyungheensis]|uniref:Integrase n=1 Tax=Pedobacter kyungheensis TaxID=1069985 RepID=A0A0C1DGJ7_9SPHI|nr:site-specific integrase [Pedobacter kyungheensis]KIA96766.1 integrase [Pedobacter kyungheensis]